MSGDARQNAFELFRTFKDWLETGLHEGLGATWQAVGAELLELLEDADEARRSLDWVVIEQRALELAKRAGLSLSSSPQSKVSPSEEMLGHVPVLGRGKQDGSAVSPIEQVRGVAEARLPACQLTVWPGVEHDDVIVLGESFRVTTWVELEPDSNNPKAGGIGLQAEGATVEIEMLLPCSGAFASESTLRGTVEIDARLGSARLTFFLRAEAHGTQEFETVFRVAGQERARLVSKLEIRSGAGPTFAQRVRAPLHLPDLRLQPPLLLSISRRANQRAVCLRDLESSHPFVHEGMVESSEQKQSLLEELMRGLDMEGRSKESSMREHRLRSLGAHLATQLLPQSIVSALASYPQGRSLHIESDDAQAPWELVYLGGESGAFLGEHFGLTRWLHCGMPRDVVSAERAVLVAPEKEKGGVDCRVEEKALRGVFRERLEEPLGNIVKVRERLNEGDCIGLTHFACHGRSEPEHPCGSYLVMEDGEKLYQLDLMPPEPPRSGLSPPPVCGGLVLLNACQTGIPGFRLTGHGSWADTFLRQGAAAVLATSWAIADRTAADFTTALMHRLSAGVPLAEAVLRSRRKVRQQGDATRLAYALYASPGTRVVFPLPKKAPTTGDPAYGAQGAGS